MRGTRWDIEWDHAAAWSRDIARVDTVGTALDTDLPSTMSVYIAGDASSTAARTKVLDVPGVLIAHPRAKVGQLTRAVRFSRTSEQVRQLPAGRYEHETVLTYPTIGPQVVRGALIVRDRLGMGR